MLSVVVASRNDDHGGNMVMRHNIFINALYQQAVRHKVPVELVFVNWNPPEGATPFVQILKWPAQSRYFTARVITVPAEMHDGLGHSQDLAFFQMIAKNVGIRRASHPWVLATNPDLIFSDDLFESVQVLAPGKKAFYRMFRHDISRCAVPPGDIEEQIRFCIAYTKEDGIHSTSGVGGLHTHACGDFTMMHQDGWEDLRGYPELHTWSIHIDSVFLVYADALGYQEMIIDGACYHIEHGRSWVVNPELIEKYPHVELREVVAFHDVFATSGAEHLRLNDKDWGFSDVDFLDVQTV